MEKNIAVIKGDGIGPEINLLNHQHQSFFCKNSGNG